MPRAIWKGAISFGLVNIPVNLYSASTENQLDLDMIDRRDFAPVGYRRVNKRTGEELKTELEAGLRREASDFNPARLLRERK